MQGTEANKHGNMNGIDQEKPSTAYKNNKSLHENLSGNHL
jgi:hypothetical protein